MALDIAAAKRAIEVKVGRPLGLGVTEAALGIVQIADAAMSLSVRAVSVHKGVDPRDTSMIAFGGAGPLHALAIAREIFIPRVFIPKLPGNFSALGMLMASWRQDFVRTLVGRIGALEPRIVAAVFEELAHSGAAEALRDGIDKTRAAFRFYADLRYVGQEHALQIPVDGPSALTAGLDDLRRRFHAEHDKRYGQAAIEESLEIVNVRLVVTAARPDSLAEAWLTAPWQPEGKNEETRRDVVFADPAKPVSARILWRPSLPAGFTLEGPAVIEEPNSTILIHPGDRVNVNPSGHLLVDLA
jgi:N-methylhydantoinase A